MTHRSFPNLVEDPEPQDSEHLTNEDVASAIDTTDQDDWVQNVVSWAAEGFEVSSQEQLRRGEDLFIRTKFAKGSDEKVLVSRTNWLGSTP